MKHRQRGNILFLILLAVVLFAALAYAVTGSQKGQTKDASPEKMDLFASQMVQSLNLLENTMMRAMTVDGIPDYGFDFDGNFTDDHVVPNATCTQSSCRVFNDNGGSVPRLVTGEGAASYMATPDQKYPFFNVAQVVNIGTSAPDVLIVYNYVSRPACDALNKAFGATGISYLGDSIGGTSNVYNGTQTSMPASTGMLGDENTTLAGKRAACFGDQPCSFCRFYYVLVAR